jgi:hypothetical protein
VDDLERDRFAEVSVAAEVSQVVGLTVPAWPGEATRIIKQYL